MKSYIKYMKNQNFQQIQIQLPLPHHTESPTSFQSSPPLAQHEPQFPPLNLTSHPPDQTPLQALSTHLNSLNMDSQPLPASSPPLLPPSTLSTTPLPSTEADPSPRNSKINKKQSTRERKNVEAKCWNKQCLAKGVEKNKSQTLNRTIWLCTHCSKNYKLGQFCEYCEQIYSAEEVDHLDWAKCQNQKCSKWNHKSCQKTLPNDSVYMCSECRVERPHKLSFSDISESLPSKSTNKKEFNVPEQRIRIFKEFRESFGGLESMLTSYSYKLSCSEDQLRQDNLFSPGLESNNNPYLQFGGKRKKYKKHIA